MQSFIDANLFGAKLGAWVASIAGSSQRPSSAPRSTQMLIVMIPLMIMAGIFTHITARHSVARQTEAQAANPQSAIMNKLMLYVFPIGVVVGAPFLPLAILLYWVANNLWTLGQQYVVYKRIDAEESARSASRPPTNRQALAPEARPEAGPAGRPRPAADDRRRSGRR